MLTMPARVLLTECLKLKRTLALWMVLVSPMVVVALQSLVAYVNAANLTRGGRDPWPQLAQNIIGLWTVLMMPLFVTLETSLLAGLEHADKNWKSLLALPAPRWTIYLSKLVVTIGLLWLAHAVLIGGALASGALLKWLRPELKLAALPWSPLVSPLAKISASALFAVAIQHWVSLRWPSFTVAMGFGMCAMVVGFIAVNSAKWGPWVPWSMALHAIRPAATAGPDPMIVAIGGAVVVALLGCWDFSRREIV